LAFGFFGFFGFSFCLGLPPGFAPSTLLRAGSGGTAEGGRRHMSMESGNKKTGPDEGRFFF